MLRVNFVIDRLSRAGTETQLLSLIRHIDRSRIQPSLCLLDGEDSESRELAPTDCPVLRLGLKSMHRPSVLAKAASLCGFWSRHRVDVVQTYFLDSTYFGVTLARLSGVRRVVRVRNNLGHWLTPRHRWMGRLMGRMAHVTLTNSDKGRQALLDAENLPRKRVAVLENGVDLEHFRINSPPDTGGLIVRVGVVANLRPVKNLAGLIRVAGVLAKSHPQLRFEVAGEGEQRAELEQLIGELGLRERVRLIGSVAEVPAFLARQDIAVLCSHAEGMSNALLEYMASGRAIVATAVGANPRLIRDGEEGLLIPPGNDTALAAALTRLVGDPALARQFGAAARRRVEVEFGRRAMCRRFEDFYERLVA